MVGRSLAFWEFFHPVAQEHFPDQLGQCSPKQMYDGVNVVRPSLIRVEADEATYNLHIAIRFDLEKALIEGELEPTSRRVACTLEPQPRRGAPASLVAECSRSR